MFYENGQLDAVGYDTQLDNRGGESSLWKDCSSHGSKHTESNIVAKY